MSAAIAEHVGARRILLTDVNDHRLELAKKVCSAELLNPTNSSISEKMKDMGLKEGFDVGLEMSGSEFALRDMVDNMIMGGNVALLGLSLAQVQLE